MQTPPLLILSGWSARTKLYSSLSIKLSGVEEFGIRISNEHLKSCL